MQFRYLPTDDFETLLQELLQLLLAVPCGTDLENRSNLVQREAEPLKGSDVLDRF